MAHKVLIVDDSPTMRRMLRAALASGGFDVVEGADGSEGLARLREQPVDLVITDVNMPVMDGLRFLQELRAEPAHRAIPVLVLTTEAQRETKELGRRLGATGWMVKPFAPEALLQTVGKVLRR